MIISYERIYLIFNELVKKTNEKKYGLIEELQLTSDLIKLFEDFGILITEKDKFIFLELSSKTYKEIDLYFLYKNYKKLNKIIGENTRIRFFINYILFNINTYLTSSKLVELIKNKFNEQYIELNILDEDIVRAHLFLVDVGLIKKNYCDTSTYFSDNGSMVLYKNIWFYQNSRVINNFEKETCVDYMTKIVCYKLLQNL